MEILEICKHIFGIGKIKKKDTSSEHSSEKAPEHYYDLERERRGWAKEANEAGRLMQAKPAPDPYYLIKEQYRQLHVPERHLEKKAGESEERYIERLKWTANAIKKQRDLLGLATPTIQGVQIPVTKGIHIPVHNTTVVHGNTFSNGRQAPGALLKWSSGREEEEEKEVVHTVKYPLEEYIGMLQSIPIVHKVNVLFDDRPNEVSIRVEYVENMIKLDPSIIADANEELTKVTHFIRIENCERIEITYMQKEVIT